MHVFLYCFCQPVSGSLGVTSLGTLVVRAGVWLVEHSCVTAFWQISGAPVQLLWCSLTSRVVIGPLSEDLSNALCVTHGEAGVQDGGASALAGQLQLLLEAMRQVLDAAIQSLEHHPVGLPFLRHSVLHAVDGALEVHVLLVDLDVLDLGLDHGPDLGFEVQEHGLPLLGVLLRSLHPLSWKLQVGRLVGGSVDWVFEELLDGWEAELKNKVG